MMQQSLATPGPIIDAWSSWSDQETKAVVLRTDCMEVMRLHVNAGTHVPTYEAQGEMTILCVQGRVSVEFASSSSDLSSGQLLYLLTNEPFSLFGQEESSLLITVLRDTGPLAPPMIGSAG